MLDSIKKRVADVVLGTERWRFEDEWEQVDTVNLHEIEQEHGASVKVRITVGEEYRHVDTGEVRRRVKEYTRNRITVWKDELEDRNLEHEEAMWGSSRRTEYTSKPKEKWLDGPENQAKVVLGEE